LWCLIVLIILILAYRTCSSTCDHGVYMSSTCKYDPCVMHIMCYMWHICQLCVIFSTLFNHVTTFCNLAIMCTVVYILSAGGNRFCPMWSVQTMFNSQHIPVIRWNSAMFAIQSVDILKFFNRKWWMVLSRFKDGQVHLTYLAWSG
jgi:hypothetical protein